MTYLSRGTILGFSRESTPGTFVPPSGSIPFMKATYDTVIAPLKDESVRANDAVVQGLYQGPATSTWDIEMHAYPDLMGNWLRMIGPDVVTAATATTLSAATTAGATSITTAVSIPAGSTIRLDTSALIEYVTTGTPTGTGPFTIPIVTPGSGLTLAHAGGAAVTTQTTHTFKQTVPATRPPSWSLAVFDGVDYRGWAGCSMSELSIKIDPKATMTVAPKFTGFPEQVISPFAYAGSPAQPFVGYEWQMSNAGASSTRGLSFDLNLKRAVEAIHSSDGTQGPREVFAAALEASGTYKAVYESLADYGLYLANTQTPTSATLTKPVPLGGESIALTMSQSAWPKGTRDLGQAYVQASFEVEGVYKATDSGVIAAVLKNYTTSPY